MCRPEDASDLPELARILLKDGQFPGLDGVDTYELAQESVAEALEVVYDTLDSSADAKRAEAIAMPSTIVPAAGVPVNEGTFRILLFASMQYRTHVSSEYGSEYGRQQVRHLVTRLQRNICKLENSLLLKSGACAGSVCVEQSGLDVSHHDISKSHLTDVHCTGTDHFYKLGLDCMQMGRKCK